MFLECSPIWLPSAWWSIENRLLRRVNNELTLAQYLLRCLYVFMLSSSSSPHKMLCQHWQRNTFHNNPSNIEPMSLSSSQRWLNFGWHWFSVGKIGFKCNRLALVAQWILNRTKTSHFFFNVTWRTNEGMILDSAAVNLPERKLFSACTWESQLSVSSLV